MDGSSTASSFYEAPVRYDETRTSVLYDQVKKDFRELRESLIKVQKNMLGLHKETGLTVKLINELRKLEKDKKGEGDEENQSKDESEEEEKSKSKDKGENEGNSDEEQEEESDS